MVLKKDLTLYERDGEEKLIPQEVPLALSEKDEDRYPQLKGQTICIVPIIRGELKKMFGFKGKDTDKKPETTKDEDAELIVKYCKEPVYTVEELKFGKPVVVRSIVRTILEESGIIVDASFGTKKLDNDEFGKNSLGLDEKKKKAD